MHLAHGHNDIQKLLAFEDVFSKVFNIIDLEGGIEGSIIVEDCLELLSSLLSFNASNQTYFRETGQVTRLSKLLLFNVSEDLPKYAAIQIFKNISKLFMVIRLFVVPGGSATPANQIAFYNANILKHVLYFSFSPTLDWDVRAEGLKTCADLIQNNPQLQQNFSGFEVQYRNPNSLAPSTSPGANGEKKPQPGLPNVFVIEALLDLALLDDSTVAFNARHCAAQCLESFFSGNAPLRMHFLNRSIEGYLSGTDATANVLTALLDLDPTSRHRDPYKIWFAAFILLHLLHEDDAAKARILELKMGNEEEGEEVVTAIQLISSNLFTALQNASDPRIPIAYLQLLITLLFEFSPGVDDFLSDGSIVQSLVIHIVSQSADTNELVQGLSAFLAGVVYEFSSKNSPVPRSTLHSIFVSRIGRDMYMHRLETLRAHPLVRDFEMRPQWHEGRAMGDPEVWFSQTFIEFFKDNFGRIVKSLDKDPGLETYRMTVSGLLKEGISIELVDSLKAQVAEKTAKVGELENQLLSLQQKTTHLESELKQSTQEHNSAFQSAQQKHLQELKSANATFSLERDQLKHQLATLQSKLQSLSRENEQMRTDWAADTEAFQNEALEQQKAREEEMRLVQERIRGHIAGLVKGHEEAVQKVREERDAELAKVRTEKEEEVRSVREGYEAERAQKERETQEKIKAEVEAQVQHALAAARIEHEGELEKLKAELEASKAKNEETTKKFAEEAKSYSSQIDDLLLEISSLEETHATSRSALEKSKKELELEVEKVKAEGRKKEESLRKVEREKEEVQAQVDDLLMLLEELEGKKGKYKSIARERGAEVSEDEEEEEDEE